MLRYCFIAICLIASPAAAELEPYQGSDGRIFPTLEPYWGAYTPRIPSPRLGDDRGQVNPEFKQANNRRDDGGGYDRGACCGTHTDQHGSTVAIGGGVRETIQGMFQGLGGDPDTSGGGWSWDGFGDMFSGDEE